MAIRELVANIPAPRCDHRDNEAPALAEQVWVCIRIVPGDLFGLESDELHDFSAEAISECTLLAVKRKLILAEAAIETRMINQLRAQTMAHLQRAQHHIGAEIFGMLLYLLNYFLFGKR